MLSLLAGTLAANLLIPDYVEPAGALFWPALAFTVALVFPLLQRVRSDISNALRIENILMLGVVYWLLLDLLQSAYPLELVDESDVSTAFWAIGLFCMMLWLGASGGGWPLPRPLLRAAQIELERKQLLIATILSFGIGMLAYLVPAGFDLNVMYAGLLGGRWSAAWARGEYGGMDAIWSHLGYFGYLLPALTVLLARRTGWVSAPTIFAIVLSLINLMFLAQGGGRRTVGVSVGAGIFTWLITQRMIRPRLIVGTTAMVLLLLFTMQEMLRLRNVGIGGASDGQDVSLNISHLHVDDNFLRVAQIVRFFPDRHDYVVHKVFFHAFALPIPRFLWAGKPNDPGFSLPAILGKKGVSLSSSILGELYASYGLMAIVLGGLVLGRVAAMMNKALIYGRGEGRALVFSLSLMALFAGMRSVQALVQMSYMLLAWVAIAWLIEKHRAAPQKATPLRRLH